MIVRYAPFQGSEAVNSECRALLRACVHFTFRTQTERVI